MKLFGLAPCERKRIISWASPFRGPEFKDKNLLGLFQPKAKMALEMLLFQSVISPIGQPATEALYPPIVTEDGKPMNAQHDYVIRMSKKDLPPAKAFWSVTLYDLQNGFFILCEAKHGCSVFTLYGRFGGTCHCSQWSGWSNRLKEDSR